MSSTTTPTKPMTAEELENKIYKTYYQKNPGGDARQELWGKVIKAKKEINPVRALTTLLTSVENDEFC